MVTFHDSKTPGIQDSSMTEIFRLRGISFSYDSGREVFEDVHFLVKPRTLTLIRGESGAGKSTFLKLFNRFIDPSSGSIEYAGRDLKSYPINMLRRSVIYLPQMPLMIEGTIEDNLKFPFSFQAHTGKAYSADRALRWMEKLQLDAGQESDARKLSAGQKQRLALIRAILLEPDVLLLDEPGSALDRGNRKIIEDEIQTLLNDTDITILMATHDDIGFEDIAHRSFHIKERKLREAY